MYLPNGKVMWRAELPEKGTRYVSANLLGPGRLKAYASFDDVDLDLETGKKREQVWTK